MEIAERAAEVRARVEAACRAAGREPASVTLLAATKTQDAERIAEALPFVDACGENRVQEFRDKTEQNAYGDRPVHFIGQLQTNKVKYLIGKCALIHSVDSERLAEAISERAVRLSLVQPVLLEVNFGGEENKGGVSPDALPALLSAAEALPGLRVRGLMTVPPRGTPAEGWFRALHALYEGLAPQHGFDVLSMGMSADYETAIACGATLARVGTGIFGARNYLTNA